VTDREIYEQTNTSVPSGEARRYYCSPVKKALAERITKRAAELGLEVRTDYSGRCMYGRTCLGVVGDKFTLIELVCTTTGGNRGLCIDEMGLGHIFYWPHIGTSPKNKEAASC